MASDSHATPDRMNLVVDFDAISCYSRRRSLFVYPWGCSRGAGFGANYSGMIKTLTVCLLKGVGYGFVRLKKPCGIAIYRGYSDFFQPFCGEVDGCLLASLNISPLPFQAKIPVFRDLVGSGLRLATRPRADYFIFSDLSSVRSRSVPEDDPSYTTEFQMLRSRTARCLWRLNPEIRECVDRVKAESEIESANYISTLVRRGDKYLEADYASIDKYASCISAVADRFSNIFLIR